MAAGSWWGQFGSSAEKHTMICLKSAYAPSELRTLSPHRRSSAEPVEITKVTASLRATTTQTQPKMFQPKSRMLSSLAPAAEINMMSQRPNRDELVCSCTWWGLRLTDKPTGHPLTPPLSYLSTEEGKKEGKTGWRTEWELGGRKEGWMNEQKKEEKREIR